MAKRKRKPTGSVKQRIECFKEWMQSKGLSGNFKKDEFKKHE